MEAGLAAKREGRLGAARRLSPPVSEPNLFSPVQYCYCRAAPCPHAHTHGRKGGGTRGGRGWKKRYHQIGTRYGGINSIGWWVGTATMGTRHEGQYGAKRIRTDASPEPKARALVPMPRSNHGVAALVPPAGVKSTTRRLPPPSTSSDGKYADGDASDGNASGVTMAGRFDSRSGGSRTC